MFTNTWNLKLRLLSLLFMILLSVFVFCGVLLSEHLKEKENLKINRKSIKEIQVDSLWQNFLIDHVEKNSIDNYENLSLLQDEINLNKKNWIEWINPINKLNEVKKDSIINIESVFVVNDFDYAKVNFQINWNRNFF